MRTEDDKMKFDVGHDYFYLEVLKVEVIYRDNGKVILPKNVKKIGTEDGNRRVYIEDYAYSFIKDISVDEDEDGAVGILLGEVKKADGVTYVFIKGVVEVLNAAVYTDHIAFTQETWPITKKYIAQYFGDYDILGWYLSSNKITEDDMDIINKANEESFTDEDNVFFMVNNGAGDEAFWQKGENGLEAMTGYTVYFEKNPSMQRYMKENQSEYDAKYVAQPPVDETGEEEPQGQYRNIVKERSNGGNSIKRNLTAIYVLSMLVIIVVLVIGVNKINEFSKNNSSGNNEGTLAVDAEGQEQTSKTPVTSLEANLPTTEADTTEAPVTEEPTTEEPVTEEPTTEEPTTEEPTTEAPVTTQSYIVKQGDSMWGICVQFYGKYSEEYANGILTASGLSSTNDLQPGIELKIPSAN